MKRNEYTLLKRQIPDVNLHSLTGQYWFDYTNDWLPWVSGSVRIPGMTPSSNETGSLHLVHDVKWYSDITYDKYVVLFYSGKTYISLTGSNLNHQPSIVSSSYWNEIEQRAINNTKGKYYKWDGTKWNLFTGFTGYDYVIPIYLEADADEMGVMSSFDGNIEQVEQLINFTYTQSGSNVIVYNTVNPNKLRKIVDQTFTINWGDGYTSGLTVNSGVLYSNFPTSSHTYPTVTGNTTGSYTLNLSLDSPWNKEKITKKIIISTGVTVNNILGTCTGFTLPGNIHYTGSNYQNYLNDLDYTNNTGNTIFKYAAIGGSKIGELRKYGETTLSTSSYTTGTYSGSLYSGYTLPSDSGSLYYMDFADGYTMITGTTSAFTKEEVFNKVITRNEHFLGFIDDPSVYSDIFVERGRQGVMEVNLRLGEIDNMSELDVYGNGFFNVKKQ